MKNIAKNKGITLVALIITLIVMLILSGITFNILSNNGIIERAMDTRTVYEMEAFKEKVQLDVLDAVTRIYSRRRYTNFRNHSR